MKTLELIFVGIKGSVVALNRATGELVWTTRLKRTDFVNILFENRRIFASTNGELFCLDAVTGERLWHNQLKGFGTGLATLATSAIMGNSLPAVMAEKRRRDQQAAASAATTVAITST